MLNIDLEKARSVLEASSSLDWYHKFEIAEGSGVFTPGRLDTKGYQWRRKFVGLTPEFLKGKRVLDIGAYSGAFSFLLQDLGAEVVAADVYDPDQNGFSVVRKLRGKDLRHERLSVYDLSPSVVGLFDIVALYGVHYHLRHPLLAMERCNSVCKPGGLFVGGGTGCDGWFHDNEESCLHGVNADGLTSEKIGNERLLSVNRLSDLPICGYSPQQFLRDKTNWFIPSMACLNAWVESSGFRVKDSHKNCAPVLRDWNKDERVRRTSLNFMAEKISEPLPEYTWKHMKQFTIPTGPEVEELRSENERLKAALRELTEQK